MCTPIGLVKLYYVGDSWGVYSKVLPDLYKLNLFDLSSKVKRMWLSDAAFIQLTSYYYNYCTLSKSNSVYIQILLCVCVYGGRLIAIGHTKLIP